METVQRTNSKLTTDDEKLLFILQALADKNRFKMFRLMSSDSGMCVSEIAEELKISVPAVSQHFRFFELVGLVDKQRNGQKICYQLRKKDPLVKKVMVLVNT